MVFDIKGVKIPCCEGGICFEFYLVTNIKAIY